MPDADLRMRDAAQRDRVPDVVIITGMSGSGRTQAMHVFEDMGYYCIDNLPPRLVHQIAQVVGINENTGRHLAVTCDVRSQGLFDEFRDALQELRDHDYTYKVLFLDCSDEELVRRYNENRRPHPLMREGETVAQAVARERQQLEGIRAISDLVVDTSRMRTSELRRRIRTDFSELSDQQLMDVHVFSFGFKHGLPTEADLLIDVRFLPNPFYDPEMRHLTGEDPKVRDYVLDHPITKDFLAAWFHMLDVVMPGYIKEGKSHLSIAVGCTGGQHRSVAIANATARHLAAGGYRVTTSHRDLLLADVRR